MDGRRAVAVVAAAAAIGGATLGVAGCGQDAGADDPDGYRTEAASACTGIAAGREALRADGRAPAVRVEVALERATLAGRRLAEVDPPASLAAGHEQAVRALQSQAERLRAVRDQLDKGSAPGEILSAARAGLDDGDRQARARLTAVGVDCAALSATTPDP